MIEKRQQVAVISEAAFRVLEDHAVAEEKLHAIVAALTREIRIGLDEMRMLWHNDFHFLD